MGLKSITQVCAPAKLNLFLHVVGRRDDGYHLIQSVFTLIDWCDTLHFERRADGRLARRDLGTPLPADDLILRAARALQTVSGTPLGADIAVDKQVPSGAGMGGGSSDAASTLLALNRLWGLHWPLSRLLPIGLALGADVPFFLVGRPAFVEGIGEQITPVRLAARWLAVIKPAAGLETRAIFASPMLERSTAAVILAGLPTHDGFLRVPSDLGRNDLQPVAQALCPEVAQAAAMLRSRFGNSRMTGSGSAVFAQAGEIDGPAPPAPTMPVELPPGWSARMCRSLPQHPLLGWAAE
jgi:4-diphosphocytidyl-2-C-methyl-D-erythritol kinase